MADRKILELSGSYFESVIVDILREYFQDSIVLNNVELYCSYLGKKTQIDIIFLHPNLLAVIEAKNWKGWIKGNYNDVKWQGKSLSKDVMTVYSPFNQNFLHIRTLRNLLREKMCIVPPFKNYVCVPDGTDIISDCREVRNMTSLINDLRLGIARSNCNYNIEMIRDYLM